MTAEAQVSLRLTPKLVRRVDALIPKLKRLKEVTHYGALTLNRSAVLRLAIARGVEMLEKDCRRKVKNA